ncbi:hypothetical protein D1632_08140 [Chryseobacterium nematophagum]|uniref:Uncharacterized protein n=1 Tax=Chryseobacterium nematophagum TaxID=2305228 RepID=A0A3M7L9X5_9FLAO|nr:hypothetical protein [Chryseobacterium nematophagum]RMZ59591.1 hypothetical protein D1632_08140 [Chryseobacterium nematophagum]
MIIYNIGFGRSFSEISDELHLENPTYLRDFHNENCPLIERCEGDLIEGTRVFIPTKEQIAEINRNIRENNESYYDFPSDKKFPFAYDLWNGIYETSQTSYLNDKVTAIYEQKIRLELEYIKDHNYYFQFTAFDFRKNGENSETKVSTLSKMCIKSIYPIRFIINSEGKMMNIELIKKPEQILSELENIKHYFTDDHAFHYVEKMKSLIQDPEEIVLKLSKSLLITFFFGSFYRAKLGEWTNSLLYHDFSPWIFDADAIRFEFKNVLCPKEGIDDYLIKIQQKGISCDHRSLEDLYMGCEYDENISLNEKSIDCEQFAEYIFNRKEFSLQRIEAYFQHFTSEDNVKETFLLEKIGDNN